MKVLVLGPARPQLVHYVRAFGDDVRVTQEKISPESRILHGVDWLVSYGYRHIIKPDLLRAFVRRAINLHISYLPYNRGADPNLWSFLEDTPKGVTIHYIAAGVDTGDILAQRQVSFGNNETLRSTYEKLCQVVLALFVETWPDIRTGRRESRPQPAGGTSHRSKEKKAVEHLLSAGWDTPVVDLIGKRPAARREAAICQHRI